MSTHWPSLFYRDIQHSNTRKQLQTNQSSGWVVDLFIMFCTCFMFKDTVSELCYISIIRVDEINPKKRPVYKWYKRYEKRGGDPLYYHFAGFVSLLYIPKKSGGGYDICMILIPRTDNTPRVLYEGNDFASVKVAVEMVALPLMMSKMFGKRAATTKKIKKPLYTSGGHLNLNTMNRVVYPLYLLLWSQTLYFKGLGRGVLPDTRSFSLEQATYVYQELGKAVAQCVHHYHTQNNRKATHLWHTYFSSDAKNKILINPSDKSGYYYFYTLFKRWRNDAVVRGILNSLHGLKSRVRGASLQMTDMVSYLKHNKDKIPQQLKIRFKRFFPDSSTSKRPIFSF